MSGPAVVARRGGTAYLLEVEPFEIALSAPRDAPETEVCLALVREETDVISRCDRLPTGAEDSKTPRMVRFAFDRWPSDDTGAHALVISVNDSVASPSDGGARGITTIHVVRHDGDVDDDQLTNGEELSRGTNLTSTDTDRDGLLDGAEVEGYGSDPLRADTDGDGLLDGHERQLGTAPADPWTPLMPIVLIILGLVAVALAVGSGPEPGSSPRPVTVVPAWLRRRLTVIETPLATGGEAETAGMDPPMTDEDRVATLLKRAGGRERQV